MAEIIPLRPWAFRPRQPEERLARAVAAAELIGADRKLLHQPSYQRADRHPAPNRPPRPGAPTGPEAA